MKLFNIISLLILTFNVLPAQTYDCLYYEYFSNWEIKCEPIKSDLTKIYLSPNHYHRWIYDDYNNQDNCIEKNCGEKSNREEERICTVCSLVEQRTKTYGFNKSNKNSLFLHYYSLFHLQ